MKNTNKTVWLLGAGASRPLGGPLFKDLISERTERWVVAWVAAHASGPATAGEIKRVRLTYEKGVRVGLWSDAEECISLLDTARKDRIAAAVVQDGLQTDELDHVPPRLRFTGPIDIEKTFIAFTQFVAVATAHYVPEADEPLPEAWRPFEKWGSVLSAADDTILSLNYDRVVERLNTKARLLKLHGTTPTAAELTKLIDTGTVVDSIFVPGPNKLRAPDCEAWTLAAQALNEAYRLIVVGYSFPTSDVVARAFVLANFNGDQLAVVVGDDSAGQKIETTFRHLPAISMTGMAGVVNTRLFTESYLTEGTARSTDGRFMHGITWKPARLGA